MMGYDDGRSVRKSRNKCTPVELPLFIVHSLAGPTSTSTHVRSDTIIIIITITTTPFSAHQPVVIICYRYGMLILKVDCVIINNLNLWLLLLRHLICLLLFIQPLISILWNNVF